MNISNIIKKLSKTYSVVIIPNTNDSIKKCSIKAPFIKILFTLLLVLSLSIIVLFNSSQTVNGEANTEEISKEALQQQIQLLSQIILDQNKSLTLNKSQIEEFEAANIATKAKVNEFTKMYSDIASNYISKTSRSSPTQSSNTSILDFTKLSSVVEELNETFDVNDQLKAELKITNQSLEMFIDALPTLVPSSGKISSPFGMRKHPIAKVNKAHKGVDISSSKGDPILASASGVIEYSGYSKGYGYNVIINHNNGYKTLYAHSSKLFVKKGQLVKKGQTIALVGSTGVSTGPHLHFEIKIDNTAVDPTQYINFKVN